MKRLVIFLVLVFGLGCYGADPNYTSQWVSSKDKSEVPVLKLTWAAPADIERFTFDFGGTVLRVVVDVTTVDADGDITISDISGAYWLNWANKLGSGDIDYIVSSTDVDSNVYGGKPVSGKHSGVLTNCAGAGATTIYIYFSKD